MCHKLSTSLSNSSRNSTIMETLRIWTAVSSNTNSKRSKKHKRKTISLMMLVRKSTNPWNNSKRFLLLKLQTLTEELRKLVVIPWDSVPKEPTSWRKHQSQWLMSSLWIQLRRRRHLQAGKNPRATKQSMKGSKQRLSKQNPNSCLKSTLFTGNQLSLTKSSQKTLTSHPRFSKSVTQYNLEAQLSTRSLDKTQKECSKPRGDSMNFTHYERHFTIDGQVATSLTAQINLL